MKKWPYWVKGFAISILISVGGTIYILFMSYFGNMFFMFESEDFCFQPWKDPACYPWHTKTIPQEMVTPWLVFIPISIPLGILIGWLYGKIKNRKQVINQTN